MSFSGVVPQGEGPSSPAGLRQPPTQSRKRGMGRTACSRCKARKQRCDGRLPVCSSCKKSGATCDWENIRGEELVMAKYVQTLESRIADLEIQLLRHQQTPQTEPPDAAIRPSGGGRFSIGDVVNSLCFDLPDTPSFADESLQFGLHLALNLGETGPSPGQTATNNPSPRTAAHLAPIAGETHCAEGTGPPSEELGAKLIQTYSERLDWRYPFLDLEEIWNLHRERERLAQIDPEARTASQHFGLFKLYLVYAVGSGLLVLTEKQTSPTPEAFYTTAIQHISSAREPRSLENIEALVLLVIFHLRCSISQELWYLIGFAMRTCIHLGMYLSRREIDLPQEIIQKRRKLFWTVYSLERNISIALGYPVSLPDRLIDVEMPSVPEHDPPLQQAIRLFQLRRIESRIHHSIYRNDRPLQELLHKTQGHYQQLQKWKDDLLTSDHHNISNNTSGSSTGTSGNRRDYFLLHYHRAIRLLIQPFLSILPSSDPYYKACLEAAGQICQLHKRLHQNADYGHSFIAVQTVFISGIMLLYCLWTHASDVWSIRLSNHIRACSSVLFVMGERTPWVRRYRDAFEALVSVTMERLEQQQEGGDSLPLDQGVSTLPDSIQMASATDGGTVPEEFGLNHTHTREEEPMPPPLQVLQDRWMELDTMAVVNELVTWADPDPSATPWMGSFPDGWEEWQLP